MNCGLCDALRSPALRTVRIKDFDGVLPPLTFAMMSHTHALQNFPCVRQRFLTTPFFFVRRILYVHHSIRIGLLSASCIPVSGMGGADSAVHGFA